MNDYKSNPKLKIFFQHIEMSAVILRNNTIFCTQGHLFGKTRQTQNEPQINKTAAFNALQLRYL